MYSGLLILKACSQVDKEQTFKFLDIKRDIFAFLPYVKIEEPGKLNLDYQLWPNLKHFFHALRFYNLLTLIKSKQIGISWALAVYALWKIMTREGENVLEISKGEIEAIELLDKSRVVFNNLPEWMKIDAQGKPMFTLDPNNQKGFGFKELRSKITALPSTETAGIGETAGLVIHDEADFHELFKINLSHTRATIADSPDRQLVIVSTVDEEHPDSYMKNHYKEAMAGKNGFKALFYGYDARPNRDEKWYQAIVEEYKSTPWVVRGNWPRSVKEALSPQSAVSCFNSEVLDELWENAEDNPEIRQNHIFILHPPRAGYFYCAGIDVGEGVGLDYSVLAIVGKYGLQSEVSAVIYTNTVGTDSFASDCEKTCAEYGYPVLTVDNIGIGRAVIDKLVQLGYPRLYKMNETKYGWALSHNNKRELLVKLVELINNGSVITRFKPMIKELMEYQWVKGMPEPTGKTHGDTVIALMLACTQLGKIGARREATMYVGGKRIY